MAESLNPSFTPTVFAVYLFFGIMPSIIWLLFYLRRDVHPESNQMIIKVFCYGMLIALPTCLIEMGAKETFIYLPFSDLIITLLEAFIGVAFIEEFLKYLVVREKVFDHHELDEPIDVMLYMIISALGFAAVENILMLFSLGPILILNEAISITIVRFVGATFLHTLCSGSWGFFLALSFYETEKRSRLVFAGLIMAVLLHGLYNFSIMELGVDLQVLIPATILSATALFFFVAFQRLRKLKSICKL